MRVPEKIFRPKRKDVKGGWRKLHNEDLGHVNSFPNIIGVIKWIMMRWGGGGVMWNAGNGIKCM